MHRTPTPFAVAFGARLPTARQEGGVGDDDAKSWQYSRLSGWRLFFSVMMETATRTAAASRLMPAQVVVDMAGRSLTRSGRFRPRGFPQALLGSRMRGCARRNCSSASSVVFVAPPEELEDGYFERPTPLLFVAGEGHATTW